MPFNVSKSQVVHLGKNNRVWLWWLANDERVLGVHFTNNLKPSTSANVCELNCVIFAKVHQTDGRIVFHYYWWRSTSQLRRCRRRSSSQPVLRAHGASNVHANRCQVASSRSCSSQSTSHVTAMTPRPADVTISRRSVDERNVEQSLRRRRQPRSASVASTLMMTLLLVFITCDTGQSHLHLHVNYFTSSLSPSALVAAGSRMRISAALSPATE